MNLLILGNATDSGAVFSASSSNLMALVFLLLGLAGSPLTRLVRKGSGNDVARHGHRIPEQAHPEQLAGLMEGTATAEPSLIPRADDDGLLYQADWPGDGGGPV